MFSSLWSKISSVISICSWLAGSTSTIICLRCVFNLQLQTHQLGQLSPQPQRLGGLVSEDWIIPLSYELSKQWLPSFAVNPVQTSCFIGKLIKPKERSTVYNQFNRTFKCKISLTRKRIFGFKLTKGEKTTVIKFEWRRRACWNRKHFTALHPSLNPDVNSSERTSSRQHEVQWARPQGNMRKWVYGKPVDLKSYHSKSHLQ